MRDRPKLRHLCGPGSAAHHFVLRYARDTRACRLNQYSTKVGTRLILLALAPVERQRAELVVGEETVGPHAAGVAAVAPPSRELLQRLGENPPAGIDPGESVLSL